MLTYAGMTVVMYPVTNYCLPAEMIIVGVHHPVTPSAVSICTFVLVKQVT